MMASIHPEVKKGKEMITALLDHDADIQAKNKDGESVFTICDVAGTCSWLVERFLYPDLAEKPAIWLALS